MNMNSTSGTLPRHHPSITRVVESRIQPGFDLQNIQGSNRGTT